MKSFITNNDIPVGYVTPPFPSLYWPINNQKYNTSFLYDTTDIWKFSIYWCVILNECFYGVTGTIAGVSHRGKIGCIWIIFIYLFCGAVQGMVAGTIMGYMISAIYTSGLFEMSTWIPFCCAVVQILFDVVQSFPISNLTM
ncbi:hypothetical protein TBLA_0C04520 [Henningerozyma blattae CBS 6284]|uniref:Uncharacterized protein n=1 Tax=Henningerozyma blattae (strain ATCC 34711 / CBS 6284 / DSM 70876 / NBRC 10599 / NRRL Y-10934 / UCD 77-7) TaxID=1071380 RepID=I2H1J7_HENB6|nr:hypothetical protein TBLA_0C04520 [Tetrapisispora blattae CBS 6284]CCH60249.1 hypothetical protein TBLA_0C04520 [Tetrapisispora blattae CBS 6284]